MNTALRERLKQFQRAFQHELVPPVEADLKQSLTPTMERLLRIWELVEVQENGVRDSFQSQTVPDTFPHNQGIPFLDVELRFEPMPGTDGTLKVTNDNFGRLINQALAVADDPGRPLDPSGYVYTNAEGQEFILDQGFTVREIHEHEGDNRVTFGRDGVVHSAGPSITFVRDAQERIVRVIAPDLSEISYEYDALGNLIAMVDANGNRTQYTYLGGHYLQDITDPRGVRVSRQEYNDDGRLIAVIDADGHRIEYSRDIDARVETVRDRNGNAMTYLNGKGVRFCIDVSHVSA